VEVAAADAVRPTGTDNGVEEEAAEAPAATYSLNKSGYWFEDSGDVVKVSVPLEAVCPGPLPKEAATASFKAFSFHLEVHLPDGSHPGTHVLAIPDLAYDIVPEESSAKVRPKTKRVLVSLAKKTKTVSWRKLTAA